MSISLSVGAGKHVAETLLFPVALAGGRQHHGLPARWISRESFQWIEH